MGKPSVTKKPDPKKKDPQVDKQAQKDQIRDAYQHILASDQKRRKMSATLIKAAQPPAPGETPCDAFTYRLLTNKYEASGKKLYKLSMDIQQRAIRRHHLTQQMNEEMGRAGSPQPGQQQGGGGRPQGGSPGKPKTPGMSSPTPGKPQKV